MRSLSLELSAAQLSPSREGFVRVVARKRSLDWQTLYTGAEADGFHAAAFAGDGSLSRARLTGTADSRKLYRQRVVSPDENSDFSAWTYSGEYNAVAVAAAALGSEVSIFWIKSDRSIRRLKSTNYGVSFGAPELIDYSPTTAAGGIAAAYKPNGDIGLFFADQSTLYVKKRVGASWLARAAWNKSTGSLSGVACVYDGDWKLALTGRDGAGNYRLWSLSYGDGAALPAGTWGELREIAASPAAEGFDFRQAFLDKNEVYRCAYVEKFSGSEATARVYLTATMPGAAFDACLWTEPQPMDITGDYGVAIVHSGDALWLSSANSVRRAVLDNTETDLSGALVSCHYRLDDGGGRAAASLEISGAPPVALGDEICISPGCVIDGLAEVSEGLCFTVDSIESFSRKSAARATLTVFGADGWDALKRWRARYHRRWNNGAPSTCVRDIIAWIIGRCGLKLEVLSASAAAAALCPDFCLNPGADGAAAVRRLLSLVPDALFIEGFTAYLKNPLAEEASAYAYGVNHPILDCRAVESAPEVNHLRLAGAGGLVVDAFDWTSLGASGQRYRHIAENSLGSVAALQELGAALLRESAAAASTCEITAPPNCAQQLYDVVALTDEATGLAAARYRVSAIELDYQPESGKYEMTLKLGGV